MQKTPYHPSSPKPQSSPGSETIDALAVPEAGGTITSTLGDVPAMKKIIAEYVEDLPNEVLQMRDLFKRGEYRALQRVVHKLRGTGGGYGFDAISDLATTAETSIAASNSSESIGQKLDALIDVIQRIEGFKSPSIPT